MKNISVIISLLLVLSLSSCNLFKREQLKIADPIIDRPIIPAEDIEESELRVNTGNVNTGSTKTNVNNATISSTGTIITDTNMGTGTDESEDEVIAEFEKQINELFDMVEKDAK